MLTKINLPASKSESNRALILTALSAYQQNLPFTISYIENISQALDTQTLIDILLHQDKAIWDAKDAGTTFRFLTAFAIATQKNVILTGSERMKERPIAVLVDALRNIGAKIDYLEKEGFPPLQIWGESFVQKRHEIDIQANISSQYISALLMIAAVLEKGLTLNLVGKMASRPYIEMTLKQMASWGIHAHTHETQICIEKTSYPFSHFEVENDWSAASYAYAFVALSESAEIYLSGLNEDSLQGDKQIANIMKDFGVETIWAEKGIILRKKQGFVPASKALKIDFSNVPDLAQTIAVVAAAMEVNVCFTGLESLRIKETDRIAALQIELTKFGVNFCEKEKGVFTLKGKFIPAKTCIATYQDHRMAMAFAPLLLKIPDLIFENPSVVVKSFPHFWEEVKKMKQCI